jgi:hypothetical protein
MAQTEHHNEYLIGGQGRPGRLRTGVLFGGATPGPTNKELTHLVEQLTNEAMQLRNNNTLLRHDLESINRGRTALQLEVDDLTESRRRLDDSYKVVSIAGATHITDRLVDGTRATYNIIPQQFVNGDYLKTNARVNGHLVYVKILGTNVSAVEHVYIWKGPEQSTWCVGKPDDFGRDRGYAMIRIPEKLRDMDLYNLVELYNKIKIALNVYVCGRVYENSEMLHVRQPLVQISTKPLDAAIHDLHAAHLKYIERVKLIESEVECKLCFENKAFSEFIVPACGHLICKVCYLNWLNEKGPTAPCPLGCPVALKNQYTPFNFPGEWTLRL